MWESLNDRKTIILSALEKSNVSIKDLSNVLSVSEKTIRNEVQVLNHELKDSAYIYIKNGIISLFIYNFEKYKNIKARDNFSQSNFNKPKIRILYLIRRLLNEKNLQLDILAEEMNISKSTLTKDIKLANEELSNYQLNIHGKPNVGINLYGNELDKRYFILENGYKYIISNAKYEYEYNNFLHDLLVNFFINEDTIKSVSKFFHISMYRVRSGNFLKSELNKSSNSLSKDYAEISHKIKNFVKISENISLTNEELDFILIPLMGMRISSNISYDFDTEQLDQINILTDKIFERIKNQMDINVNLGDMRQNFNYHIYNLLNRMKLNYNIKNPLSENIKNEYKVAYKMSEIASDVIYEYKEKTINESEKSYLASYFQIYLIDKLNSSLINQINIAIINKNKEEAIRIIPLIQKRFSDIHKIDYYTDPSKIDKDMEYDLIISDQAIRLENVLFLANGFNNLKLIQKELDNFYFRQNIFQKERILKSTIFTELREDTLFISQGKDYETNLVNMLEYLEDKQVIDVEFTNSVLLKESQSPTKFSDQIAFPHIKNQEFILSMGIFPNSDIKVIIVVGVPNDDDTLIINLYDEIVSLSTDKNFFDVVVKARDYRQLMELIIKETELFR